jgi:hypothetical protein
MFQPEDSLHRTGLTRRTLQCYLKFGASRDQISTHRPAILTQFFCFSQTIQANSSILPHITHPDSFHIPSNSPSVESCLTHIITSLSHQGPGVHSSPVRVRFFVDTLALVQVFLRVLRGSLVNVTPPLPHVLISSTRTLLSLTNKQTNKHTRACASVRIHATYHSTTYNKGARQWCAVSRTFKRQCLQTYGSNSVQCLRKRSPGKAAPTSCTSCKHVEATPAT